MKQKVKLDTLVSGVKRQMSGIECFICREKREEGSSPCDRGRRSSRVKKSEGIAE